VRVFTVNDPVFKTEPLFVLGCTHDELAAYLQRRFDVAIDVEPRGEQLAGRMFTFSCAPWRVVWVRRRDDLSVAIHECFHLVTRICDDRGIPIRAHDERGDNADEAAAYLLEFFTTALLRKLKIRNRRA
jgi:hypothetical protein